jgi:hypothetical protein
MVEAKLSILFLIVSSSLSLEAIFLEHLQEFTKNHLANLEFCQLSKKYGK